MTYAEQALERLNRYQDGTAGDWWNDCIEGEGYDAAETDAVDNGRNQVAIYEDGSWLENNGQAWEAHVTE